MNFFDLHCDTPYECYFKNQEFLKNSLSVSGDKGSTFDNWSQFFAVWIKDDLENPFEVYKRVLTDFKEKLKNKPDNLKPYFSVEGGAVLQNDLDRLYKLKQDGIKLLTLTWNGENQLAGGSKTDKGLTDFGKDVIGEMNKIKMICDLSHINDKSFFKAVELSDFPVATHSNSRTVLNHPRNLTDAQLKLIHEKNGIIGICFYQPFLGDNVFEGIYKNIYHMSNLGLKDNIAIGSDFDGGDMGKEFNDISKIPNLYKFLSEKGLEKTFLDKIFYKNAENYMLRLEKES